MASCTFYIPPQELCISHMTAFMSCIALGTLFSVPPPPSLSFLAPKWYCLPSIAYFSYIYLFLHHHRSCSPTRWTSRKLGCCPSTSNSSQIFSFHCNTHFIYAIRCSKTPKAFPLFYLYCLICQVRPQLLKIIIYNSRRTIITAPASIYV
jgi:hypothetical protein